MRACLARATGEAGSLGMPDAGLPDRRQHPTWRSQQGRAPSEGTIADRTTRCEATVSVHPRLAAAARDLALGGIEQVAEPHAP
jgi:hypothetical protein